METIGNFLYEPAHILGRGSFGTVWRGQHRDDPDFQVAIKMLHLQCGAEPELQQAKDAFLREARILCRLQHPSIVRLFEFSWNAGRPYLVMELLSAGSLLARLRKGPPLTVSEALALTVQIAQALEIAHRNAVIHRDLKPDNIMLRGGELTPVITDFGIARLDELTRSISTQIGTPLYMAPEQFQGRAISGRTDVYALGILFYELLTGQAPYRSTNPYALAEMHQRLPLPQLPPALAPLQPVLNRMLAKDPDARFSTAAAVVEALRLTFLNDAALRTLVGYAGDGRAWSSQLRALGFELPQEVMVEVREAQSRVTSPKVPRNTSVAENQLPEEMLRPTIHPKAAEQGRALPTDTQRKSAFTFQLKAFGLLAVLMVVVAMLAISWRRTEPVSQTSAAFEKGLAYFDGNGVTQSVSEAARWFKVAADQGDANAQYRLGILYELGLGLKQSDTEANRLWLLAANQGHPKAQAAIGGRYESGRGVTKSATEAIRWYRLAAQQGDSDAQTGLKRLE